MKTEKLKGMYYYLRSGSLEVKSEMGMFSKRLFSWGWVCEGSRAGNKAKQECGLTQRLAYSDPTGKAQEPQ